MNRLELLKMAMTTAHEMLDGCEVFSTRYYEELRGFYDDDWDAIVERLAKELLIDAANELT